MEITEPPYVDEHTTLVPAEPDAVRRSLGDGLDRFFASGGPPCTPAWSAAPA